MQRTPPHRAHRQASMKKGFHSIMSAQFCSSLADNALLVAAYEMLKRDNAPSWQLAALVPMFALFYVVLAPFVGAFADRLPKGRVMFIANGIKLAGCLLMLGGLHPLLAYAVVGLGAAAYAPAKYGLITELAEPEALVKANGWIEISVVSAALLGAVLGADLLTLKNSSAIRMNPGTQFVITGKPLLREALAVLVSDDDFFSGKVTVTSSEQQEHLAGSGAIAIARERGLVKTLKVARA